MKKILLLIIGVTVILEVSSQELQYGVKGGFNINNLSITPEYDPPEPDNRYAFHFGGFIKYELFNNLSIAPELQLSFQGAKDGDPDVHQYVKLTYLNIPLPVIYNINDNIFVLAGPHVGFLVGGDLLEEDKVSGEQEIFDAGSYMKGLDFSLTVGGGYAFSNGIEISARYNLGLNDINDEKNGDAFYDPSQEIKNRVFQLSVSYYFSR